MTTQNLYTSAGLTPSGKSRVYSCDLPEYKYQGSITDAHFANSIVINSADGISAGSPSRFQLCGLGFTAAS
jgi:hypothetical protein